jgi:hypothetical protein
MPAEQSSTARHHDYLLAWRPSGARSHKSLGCGYAWPWPWRHRWCADMAVSACPVDGALGATRNRVATMSTSGLPCAAQVDVSRSKGWARGIGVQSERFLDDSSPIGIVKLTRP